MGGKLLKFLTLSFVMLCVAQSAYAQNEFYWVGGSGVWDDYAIHWATTSGGSTFHTAFPDQNSNVYFDQNSFPGPGNTVTVGDPTIFCHNMSWISIPNGTTFVCGANINISGSLTYAPNMVLSNNSGVTTFISGTNETINSGGSQNPLKNVTFNGNGTWNLLNYLNVDNDITLDKGTLITNSNDLMCSKFISTPAILTNLRILNIGNSHFYIKSANNLPYLSWNVDNSQGTFHIINPGTSVIHFLATSGLSTMHAGLHVLYHDAEFDGNGRMEVDLDTIHNATFHGNGEIIGDSNVFHNVQCDQYGMINGHNNIFNDVNIDGKGDIGNLSLGGRDVNHNLFHDVSIGKEGHVYGDYNKFNNLLFSTNPDWPCDPDVCCYAGPTDPGYLYGHHDTVVEKLVFHREGHVFGGINFFYDATFWCDGWVLQGSNHFFNLNLYRHYQECFATFQGIVPLSIHPNVLTLQSDSTQHLYNDFNLLGNLYCAHTEIKSSSTSIAANLNSDSILVLDYIKLTYIHSANLQGITDTATRSEDNGGNFFWNFGIPYVNVGEGLPAILPTSPCYGNCNGQATFFPTGGVPPYSYSTQIWMPGFDGTWTGLQASNTFTQLCAQNYPFLIVDNYGCLLPFHELIPSPPQIDTTYVTVTPIHCFGEHNGSIEVGAIGGTGTLTYSIDAGITYQPSNLFGNLPQGNYHIRIKDAVGCYRDFGPFHIKEPAKLLLTTGGQNFSVKCHADSTALIIAMPSGGTPPYAYIFSGPIFSSDYTTYTTTTSQDTIYGHGGLWEVTVTDAHGCTATTQTQRTDPAPIQVNVSVSSSNNCADTNHFVLHGSAVGGTGNPLFFGYNWYDSTNTLIGIGSIYQYVSLGIFKLVVDDFYHCKDSTYKTISILHDSITFLKNKSCKGSSINDGSICVTGLQGSASYSYLWSFGPASQCVGGLDTGMYVVTVTDAQYGCKVVDSIMIHQPDSVLSMQLFADSTSCFGLTNGIARVIASGGTPPYTFQWTGNSGLSNNDSIINQAVGTYFVKVTDSKGCNVTGSVTIFSPPPGQVQFDSGWNCSPQAYWAQAIVSGGTLPYTYNWSPSYGSTSDIVMGPSGMYQVTVTDGKGCPYQGSVTLHPFQVLLDIHDAKCYHDSTGWVKVNASHGNPPYTYKWFRSGPPLLMLSSSTSTQSGLNAGNYFVVIQDPHNCSDTTFFSITEPIAPVDITIQVNSINNLCYADCKGFAVATTQGGSYPYTYSWNGPNSFSSTAGIISNLCHGVYHVTVTDKNGCVMIGKDTITSPPDIIIDSIVVDSLYCNLPSYTGDAMVYAHGGIGTLKYRLDGGVVVGSNYFNNLTAGNHNIEVSDFYGCLKTKSFNVPAPVLLIVTINTLAVPLSFTGTEGQLSTSVTGGSPGYTYLWGNGAATPGISGLAAGLYCVTATDSHGCAATNCKILTAPGQLVLTANSTNVSCHGANNGQIIASVTGGVAPYLVFSTPFLPGVGTNPKTFSNLVPGTYYITVNDNNSIIHVDTVVITEPPAYNLSINFPDSICPGTTEGWAQAVLSGNTPNNNPPYYNYTWSGGTSQTPEHIINLSPGNYTLSVTDSRACAITRSFSIKAYDKPVAVFSQPAPICLGNLVVLNNMSSVLHSTLVKALVIWGDGPAQTYNYPTGIIQHQYNSPGTYSISMMVTDANQCSSDLLSHAVQVLPIPKAIISYDTACFGNKTTLKDLSLNSNPPGSWYVNGSSFPYQSTITPIINHAGLIPVKLIVQNSLACKDSVSVLVPVDSLPIPSFNYHDSICVAGMIRFWNLSVANGSPIAHYQWNFSDGYGSLLADPLHSFLQTNTSYNVGLTVISARGCSDSIHKNVTVSLPFSLGISTDTVCLGSLTHFNGKALTPAGDNLALQYWYFGDGNSSLAVNPVHHYVNPGTYTAILVGIDEHGCQDMAFDSNVIVNPLPTASFSYQVHCQGNVVDFLSTSQLLTSTGNTLEWTWQSGGAPQTTNNPAIQHTYPGPGTYQVRLVVFNGNKCSDTIVKQLVIDPPLQVSFTYDTACIGGSVHFQDLTQIAPSTWLWDFGTVPSSSATVANPLHAFTTAGNYIITLTAFDVNHCPYSLLKTIKILPLPLADFSTLPVNNCQQDSVHFIDISTTANGNIITRTWDFGDIASGNDNLSILQNPSHLYLQANSYSVTLGVQSNAGNGCVDTASHIILVRPSPIANFTFNLACFGDSTAFANISTPVNANSLSYVWNFGEASSATNNVSIQKNPKHHYASPGTYVVSLVVKDEFSCPDTIKKSVTVLPLPIVSFSHTTLCLGNPVQFTNLTNPLVGTTTQWYWTFGDPQSFTDSVSTLQNPQHTYISTGNYTVMLSVVTSNGCKSSTLSLISIPASPVANFSATDTCLGKQSFFHDLSTSANSPISSWAWDFGDTQNSGSQNPVHLFNFSGVYPVKLSVTDNAQCKGSKTIPVYVHALPNPDFYSVAYCTDNPVYFFDNSSGAGFPLTSWNWNFGDPSNLPNTSTVQNSSHAYTAQNFYNVSLSVVNSKGCENTLTQSVFIPTGAVADFSITNIDTCVGQLIHFHDLSYASGSTVTNWYWDFGNSIISTLKNPSLVFYSAGIQHVSLTITTSSGCTKTILRDIMVNPLPSVQFTYVTPLCEGSAVSFNGIASSPGSSGVFTWLWHMGYNGNQSTLQNPLPYTYPASGTYNVELNVTDSHHCTNKYVSAVAVYPKPAADFSFNLVHPPCENRLVCFTDHTNWFNSQPSVYFWTFGNSIAPDTSFLPDPCYTYPLNGNYIATLDVTSNYGCTNQVSKTVPVFPPVGPLAHFNTPMPPAGVHCTVDTVHFMDGSTSAGGSIAQWDWSFGDPTTGILDSSSLSSPYHLFSHAGTYAITLTVTDNNFCSSTFSSLITINPSPKAGFTMSNDCQGTLISFNDTSVSAANLTSWNWTADGVGAGNTANMHHLFSVTGNHSIKLVVTTQAGCSSSASKTLLVYPAPTASFLIQPAANACVNTAVSFDASASLANFGSNISYSWSFGDATIASVGPLVSHSYSLTQNYTINLFVENIHGCKDTLTKSLLVRPLPKPAIGVNSPTCLNDTIQFQGTSTVPNGSIQTWNWYFDHNPPGNYSSIQNPKHQFPASAPGPFHVQLTVTDAYCSSLITDTLTIHPLPVVNFTSDIACIGSPTHFTDLSTSANGPITSWKWYNGIPNVSTVQNPAFVLPVQGFNPVKLIVKDSKNCQNGITKLIAVDSLPIAAFSWHDTCTSGFNAGMIHFTDLSNPNSGTISNWTWNFTSGNSSSLQNPSYIFNPVNQNYPVTLTVSRRGCQVSVTHSVFVNPAFAIDFTYQASCLGSPSTFIPQVVQPVNMQHGLWSWKFGDNSPNGTSLGNTTHNFPLTGSYYVQLTTTSVHGCTDSIGHMIEVFPLPLPSFTYDTTYCFDATHFTNLSTAGSGTITTFNWNFGDGAPNVTTANPSHVYPPSGGSYWVKLTVTNSDNCNKTDSILVIHMPCGSAGFTISDTLPCTNIPITFTDTTNLGGSATFVDRIWDFGGFAPPSHASPVTVIYSAAGTYTVMLIVKFQANSIQFSDTAIHQFTIFATPIAKIASDSACLGKDIHLVNQSSIATGAYSNLWNFGIPGGISIQQNPSPVHYNSPGAYLVTLSLVSDHNCRDTAQRIVHVWPIPVAAFSADPATYCGIPDKVTFTDLSSGTIDHLIWNFDYGIPATSPPGNQIMNYNAYGVFDPSLIVVSEKGCSDTIQHPGSITVLHKPVPSFSYDPKPVSILSSTVQFYNNSVSPGNFVCNWNFGDNTGWYPGNCNPNYTFADTGDYHVTLYIMDQNGCDSSVTEVLSVDGEMTVYVPNAFTPDGDNLNDVFGPTGKYLNPDAYEMVIYSRWGQELFSSTKPEIGWNGSVNGGVIAPVGVYVYYIRVKDLKGSTREFKGYVTLLRKD